MQLKNPSLLVSYRLGSVARISSPELPNHSPKPIRFTALALVLPPPKGTLCVDRVWRFRASTPFIRYDRDPVCPECTYLSSLLGMKNTSGRMM